MCTGTTAEGLSHDGIRMRGRSATVCTFSSSQRSVSETATWDEFVALIRARLQLENVRAIYHASTMTPLTSMNDLQDIEDLVVDGDDTFPPGADHAHFGGLTPASAYKTYEVYGMDACSGSSVMQGSAPRPLEIAPPPGLGDGGFDWEDSE